MSGRRWDGGGGRGIESEEEEAGVGLMSGVHVAVRHRRDVVVEEEEEESSGSAVGTDAEIVRDQQPHTCTSADPSDRREPTVADDDSVVVDLIGMLRNCLCDISNDRGDVLCGAAAMRTEHDDDDVAAVDEASQTGPLGDA